MVGYGWGRQFGPPDRDWARKTTGLSDVEIVRRVLAHIDAGTTDEGDAWREPVQNYLDPDRFTRELQMLRSFPSVYAPSAAIPNAGDHIERVAFGVPLFAVRGHDGKARVFRNACRHRALALVEGPGCAHALVCRYHGWTYRLDGTLSNVPHADAFPGLDPSERGLVEVASREVHGLIVIGALDAPGPDCDDAMTTLSDGSPWRDKLLPAKRLVNTNSVAQPMNWKVLVEQFLEGYHIRSTHKNTFYPLQYDDLNVIEPFGPHTRITFPYKNIERLRDRPESAWNITPRVTFVYHLFPNAMFVTFPDQVLVIIVDPVDIGHSTMTSYAMTTGAGAEPVRFSSDSADRGLSLLATGAIEDNEMSVGVQRGLHAGANAFVEFGTHESALGRFHTALDERLDRIGTR